MNKVTIGLVIGIATLVTGCATVNKPCNPDFLAGQKIFRGLTYQNIKTWNNINGSNFLYSAKYIEGMNRDACIASDPQLYKLGFLNRCSMVQPKYDFAWVYVNVKSNPKGLNEIADKNPKIKAKLNEVLKITR